MSLEKYTIHYDDSHNTYYIMDNLKDDYLDYDLEFKTLGEAKEYLRTLKIK